MRDCSGIDETGSSCIVSPFLWSSPRCHLVQSEWCVVPTPALYVSKRQGNTEKAEMSSPVPVQKEVQLKQTEQEKKHNPWLSRGRMLRCGELKRRAVSCRSLDVEFGEKPISSWRATSFALASFRRFVRLATMPLNLMRFRKSKNARVP